MKKSILALFLFSSMAAFAQPEGRFEDMEEKREKIEAIKVGFITQELDFTVEESQAFWPVYNEMSAKEFNLRKQQRSAFFGLKDFENASDKEVEKAIMELADLSVEIEELRKEYLPKYIDIIGAKKTAKLIRAEKEFGKRLMERMKDGDRPDRRGPGGRPMR
jgi:polysaccharide pyruvyl transferase WcaK-like protein